MEAELKDLLTEAQSLSPLQQSKVAAVMGALVADAASKLTCTLSFFFLPSIPPS